MTKKLTFKPGYYIRKNEGYLYLYVPEVSSRVIFLSTDSGDTTGFTNYDTKELLSRCEYLGKHVRHLAEHVNLSS